MSARLKSEIWVSAWLRRCAVENVPAVLRHRGAPEAGAIFLKIDLLDGRCALYGPAMQADYGGEHHDRLFRRLHDTPSILAPDAEETMVRELKFDPDLWLLEAEDRLGRVFADLASG